LGAVCVFLRRLQIPEEFLECRLGFPIVRGVRKHLFRLLILSFDGFYVELPDTNKKRTNVLGFVFTFFNLFISSLS